MNALALIPTLLCTAWAALGTAALVDVTSAVERSVDLAALPPVSVLKPLCGADPSLEDNLASFFVQSHPRFELVFGVERADDPSLAVLARLQERFPHVAVVIVVHSSFEGSNPKVRNLRAMIPRASHDLILISDSNVKAPSDYVARAVASKVVGERVGIVTNLFVATGGRGVGAALEAVELAGFCAAGVALPTSLGDVAVVGKAMLLSRAEFDRIGGIARVADVLAEDYIIGKMFEHAGYRVVVSPVVLQNTLGYVSLRAFAQRHLRWAMMRARLRPFGYLFEPLTSPLAVLPFAWAALGPAALVWAVATLCVRDVVASYALQGTRELHRPLIWGWLRELVALGVWAVAPFRRHVAWRGHRVRIGAGTILYQED